MRYLTLVSQTIHKKNLSRHQSQTCEVWSTAGRGRQLASDWSRVITWPGYWPLIGLEWSTAGRGSPCCVDWTFQNISSFQNEFAISCQEFGLWDLFLEVLRLQTVYNTNKCNFNKLSREIKTKIIWKYIKFL